MKGQEGCWHLGPQPSTLQNTCTSLKTSAPTFPPYFTIIPPFFTTPPPPQGSESDLTSVVLDYLHATSFQGTTLSRSPLGNTTSIGCMVVYGGAWWCMVVHGGVWWCMVVYGGAWWCMVVYGGAWWCMVVHGGVW